MGNHQFRRLATCLLLAGVCLTARSECQRMIVTADPAYPPMHWYDGKTLQGVSIEIAKRVLNDLNIPYEVRYVGPFPRVISLAERGEVDMIATLKRTPDRDLFLLYPETPALWNPVAVFTARHREFEFKDRSDLIGRRGGITRGNLFGDGFDDYLKANLTVEEANTPDNSFAKLSAGRIDYFITGLYTGMAYLLKRGEEEKFTALPHFVTEAPNFIALTRRGACADKLAQIESRLAYLKKSGVLAELVRVGFAKWKAQPVIGPL